MTDKELFKLALDALEWSKPHEDAVITHTEAITALKERLAQEKALQALHNENERLGLYRDAYAEPDLIARLRHTASKGVSVWGDLMLEAAKELEILTAERECYASAMDRMLAQPEQEPVAWKWHQAPVKTSWGHDMVVADLAIDKDNTVSVYCERDQTTKVEAMFSTPPQRAWVGLTLERKMDMAESYFSDEWAINRAVQLLNGCENALKKENT